MTITETLRGVAWMLEPVSVGGALLTLRALDHDIAMAASLLDFKLSTARCVQISDFRLSDESIEALTPWLKERGARWKLGGWKPVRRSKGPKVDPRQLELFK